MLSTVCSFEPATGGDECIVYRRKSEAKVALSLLVLRPLVREQIWRSSVSSVGDKEQ